MNLWQIEYGHRIRGKLDLLLGGGPEWVHRSQPQEEFLASADGLAVHQHQRSAALRERKEQFRYRLGQVSLRYRVSALTNFSLTYLRFVSSGSGFFGGAKTDTGRLNVNHTLGPPLECVAGHRLLAQFGASGSDLSRRGRATSYSYWYFGGAAHRRLGTTLWGFWQLSIQRLCLRFQAAPLEA